MSKIKLNKYESTMLLVIKNHDLEQPYTFEEYKFLKTTEESILNDYLDIYLTYCEIVMIEPKYLELKFLNNYMIDILNKLDNSKLIHVIKEIQGHRYVESTGYGMNKELTLKYSPTQVLFFELVSGLRCVRMLGESECGLIGQEENIYDLNYSLMFRKM